MGVNIRASLLALAFALAPLCVSADPQSNTVAQTAVAVATTTTTILAANQARQMASIYNGASNPVYVCLGTATCTTSTYTVQIVVGAYYELPIAFHGIVSGIDPLGPDTVNVAEYK